MSPESIDADDDALAGIDLQMWRVPPPAAVDRASLLVRALSPATAPTKRTRTAWLLAAIVLVNIAITTVIVIVFARPSDPRMNVTVSTAAGGPADAQVRSLLQRLEQEQRELERKLAELRELRALVAELQEKVDRYDRLERKLNDIMPKQRERKDQGPTPGHPFDPYKPVDNADVPVDPCDEVACVLSNYQGACCAKLRAEKLDPSTFPLPDGLDRQSITNGVASVKAAVSGCSRSSLSKGKVKVSVRVDPQGRVTNVVIESTPDAALGACVAAAVQRAVFNRTRNGGSFTYPFVF